MKEKYIRVQRELKEGGISKMKCIGNSMRPRIESHSIVTFKRCNEYEIDDIVFCKVKDNIYVHLVLKVDTRKGYLIGNTKGKENGWTHIIWGKAINL